ncbi:centromere protein R isoform X5 [Canis lupus baileyi]|uniref:centromere protein R isoform X3 n=1 Tax=Canis lupus dingo TaxID=286419 RepID=UPI000DC67D92|nr:centromere protein R isoform X3 [Canis lupus dingo]XP_038375536.1 centromere protein R isoform X3 [Canis lupus familiaris]XP_038393226.1 centromere protein R isoform X3 [Canis lupus familiaris]XP_038521923.1 centromere protein R isoform X3 [Canis lupus familiaris]XP_048965489.1 centromere protein R isoform X3 [Canis lupus dingo]
MSKCPKMGLLGANQAVQSTACKVWQNHSVRRSLKLDHLLEANSFNSSKITRKKSIRTYSPTTGTCQMSPFGASASSEEQEHKNEPSNEKRKKLNHLSLTKRKESTTKDNNEFMMLLSKVEKSSEEIMEIMQNLSSIQALEGSRELENILGISCASCFLQREMRKTKELMIKVTEQKLFEKKCSEFSNKDSSCSFFKISLRCHIFYETLPNLPRIASS